jgi:hypothetical protein
VWGVGIDVKGGCMSSEFVSPTQSLLSHVPQHKEA